MEHPQAIPPPSCSWPSRHRRDRRGDFEAIENNFKDASATPPLTLSSIVEAISVYPSVTTVGMAFSCFPNHVSDVI